jgi:hypothetical protein
VYFFGNTVSRALIYFPCLVVNDIDFVGLTFHVLTMCDLHTPANTFSASGTNLHPTVVVVVVVIVVVIVVARHEGHANDLSASRHTQGGPVEHSQCILTWKD